MCDEQQRRDVRLQSARFHFPASPDPLDCGAVTFHLLSDRTCFHPGLTNVQLSDVKVERCSGLTSSRLTFSFAGGLSQGSRQNVLVCLEVAAGCHGNISHVAPSILIVFGVRGGSVRLVRGSTASLTSYLESRCESTLCAPSPRRQLNVVCLRVAGWNLSEMM